jgi:hypothetical protein
MYLLAINIENNMEIPRLSVGIKFVDFWWRNGVF